MTCVSCVFFLFSLYCCCTGKLHLAKIHQCATIPISLSVHIYPWGWGYTALCMVVALLQKNCQSRTSLNKETYILKLTRSLSKYVANPLSYHNVSRACAGPFLV